MSRAMANGLDSESIGERRRRFLFVVHYPVFGGPHNQALRLGAVLAEHRWDTVVLLPDEPGDAADRLRAAGLDVVQMPLHRLRHTRRPAIHLRFGLAFAPEIARIRRLIRERQIDLVVVTGLLNPHAAIAARLEGVPVVWQIVDSRTPQLLRVLLMPIVRRLSDSLMFDGDALMDLHAGGEPFDVSTFTYYPPVDTSQFRISAERRCNARAVFGIPAEAPVVGMVANLTPQKGIEFFVRAARYVYERRPDAWFLVVGAEYDTHRAYMEQLKREVEGTGIPSERLIFTGARSDVELLYPAMDVKLITSVPRSEGTTTTAMEAMACGVPVVATDVGAVREVVEDGITGFVVPPLDPEAIAGAALRLLDDHHLHSRQREAGRQRAVERYGAESCAETHMRAFQAAIAHHRLRKRTDVNVPAPRKASPGIRDLLVCPACRKPLCWSNAEARCEACLRVYPVVDGIPILLLDQSAAEHDELEHHHHGHKHAQADFFDAHVAEEFEITRPHGTPRLYRWLLREKFRRSVAGLRPMLAGATALTVCGGSGMDAEFLCRSGARVIASDLSLGAAQRARERARRYGLPIMPIVADVERLPFGDRSVDLVYVHDGLHHLEEPDLGLAEMGRVAARAVSVTEPAQALATALAIRVGWSIEYEEAGNRIARLTAHEIARVLGEGGFKVVHRERYAMKYPHEPGRLFTFLSRPGNFAATRLAWRIGNSLIGRLGNKLTVQARRPY